MQGVIQIYILLLAYTERAAAEQSSKLQDRHSSNVGINFAARFVSKSIMKDVNVFASSWFCTGVSSFSISILRGGEGGEGKCCGGGVPSAS